MNLKFTTNEITEYAVGNVFHKINDGKAFTVEPAVGRELLHVKHFIGGKVGWVNVFEQVGAAIAESDDKPAAAAAPRPRTRRTRRNA